MKRKHRLLIELDLTKALIEDATSKNDRRTQLIAELFGILGIRVMAILILNSVFLGALVGYCITRVL